MSRQEVDPDVNFRGRHHFLSLLLLTWFVFGGCTETNPTSIAQRALSLSVSPDIEIGKPPTAPVAEKQGCPAIACTPAGCLVVWEDFRANNGDIYAARVSPSGQVLDPGGFVVAGGSHGENQPAVSYDGAGTYLVVWQDFRQSLDMDIYGARVKNDGTVLDPGGFAIADATVKQYGPSVAFGNGSFLVVWAEEDGANGEDIYGARVDGSATVLDPVGFAVSTAPRPQRFPKVSFGANRFLVVWYDWRRVVSSHPPAGDIDIFGARIDAPNIVLDPDGIAISDAKHDQVYPSVAFGGGVYLVAWIDHRNSAMWSTQYDLYAARVGPDGKVLDPSGTFVSGAATGSDSLFSIGVAHDNDFLVSWHDNRIGASRVYATRVDHGGLVLDPPGALISNPKSVMSAYAAAGPAGGDKFLFAYSNLDPGDLASSIRGNLVSWVGAPTDGAAEGTPQDGGVDVTVDGSTGKDATSDRSPDHAVDSRDGEADITIDGTDDTMSSDHATDSLVSDGGATPPSDTALTNRTDGKPAGPDNNDGCSLGGHVGDFASSMAILIIFLSLWPARRRTRSSL